jgi:2-oxoglutarate dehydrogenase E2 component (dihydrolipoamide succinyltransferase)
MAIEIIVPTLGESVSDATVARWIKTTGDIVAADEPVVELETDKVTLEVPAPAAGQISDIVAAEGTVVEVGAILAHLKEGAGGALSQPANSEAKTSAEKPVEQLAEKPVFQDAAAPIASVAAASHDHLSPAVRRLVTEHNLDPARISGTGVGGRLTKADILNVVNKTPSAAPAAASTPAPARTPPRDVDAAREERVPMSKLRKVIASRLKSAQNTAAMLTTFNEVDMSALITLRADFKEAFETVHDIRLGFMGVFVQASIQALRKFPAVNAEIDGDDIIYKNYYNIGVAVGTPQGLVVPVIKDAGTMSLAATEQAIADFGARARDGKIIPNEMVGGTFTISNGGVYGSLMSTPILNPPQRAILGMHKIDKRPVVVDDQIVIRPMMYLALSYDHRIIDGREAVSFLKLIKDVVEDPRRLLLGV